MDFLGFPPFVRLERAEARLRSTTFTAARHSPEEMRALCRKVAADLGLLIVEDDASRLHLRDPFMLRVFPVEVVVKMQGEYGDVEVQVTGYSGPGVIRQTRYVDRLISTFADRVQRGGNFSEGAVEMPEKKRARRTMLRYLRAIQWIPLALLLPVVVVTQVYWDGLKSVVSVVAWAYLVLAVPSAASFFRRRVAGVGSAGDLVPFAAATGAFAVGVVLWLVFG